VVYVVGRMKRLFPALISRADGDRSTPVTGTGKTTSSGVLVWFVFFFWGVGLVFYLFGFDLPHWDRCPSHKNSRLGLPTFQRGN